jgi:OOP family OmpA-OmpF porin
MNFTKKSYNFYSFLYRCIISYNFGINFDNNNAKINPEFIQKIEKFAEFLKIYQNIKVEIQRYTYNIGKYAYNVIFSQKKQKSYTKF